MVSYNLLTTCIVASSWRLNPYCSGQWFRTLRQVSMGAAAIQGLNPYCSGQWFRTYYYVDGEDASEFSLNPYCSGQWFRTLKS